MVLSFLWFLVTCDTAVEILGIRGHDVGNLEAPTGSILEGAC